jgi:hypothetical protein
VWIVPEAQYVAEAYVVVSKFGRARRPGAERYGSMGAVRNLTSASTL